jgi:hypothetical protein
VREITVKGRKAPVMAYEVLGLKGEPLLPREAEEHAAPPALAIEGAHSS